ncbi:MAG TPA: M2 family metallopeptidase [Pirellulales bacterium]|jgi:peptidyl-dipeptidase A|nr:M2 family metallopeptidase [Pirellulales bacterium]
MVGRKSTGGWVLAMAVASPAAAEDLDALARGVLAQHAQTIQPLEIEAARRFWDANESGTDVSYGLKNEADRRLDTALADRDFFRRLKRCHEATLSDALVARQIRLLYLQALARQVDSDLLDELAVRANGLEMRFNAFRARVGQEELPASKVRKILRESADSDRRRAVWEASRLLGAELAPELLALVKLRNRSARQLGFSDYHAMLLDLNEQMPDDVLGRFDEVEALTREPFLAAKRDIDARLAAQCHVALDELRPWHYHDPFFREPPLPPSAGLDRVFAGLDVVELSRQFYAGIGLPVDEVLQRSDLYEKPRKHPSAFCLDIDRAGDVRVLANVVPNAQWATTMLHELGHAVYGSQNMPDELPYLLRCESHLLTTEGLAAMFERFATDAEWLTGMGVRLDNPTEFREATRRALAVRLLVFSRFSQVVFRFERELYQDPDQDLGRLWWELVEKYQGLRRPDGRNAPDYACQLHIATAPAYFHNYLLGELFACQLQQAIARELFGGADPAAVCYVGRREVGDFLRRRVVAPGRRLSWNELCKFATGEELSARAFAEFIE